MRPRALFRLVAAAALAAQAGSLVHALAVAHVTCPRDGELIHAPQAGLRGGSPPAADVALSVAVLAAEAGGHDRCLCPLTDESGTTLGRAASRTDLTGPPTRLAVVTRMALPAPAISLLLLAPKNGPPGAIAWPSAIAI